MSRVFEALQKTRAGRKSEDATTPLSVQSLIQRIESADALERKASVEPREESVPGVTSIIAQPGATSSHRLGLAADFRTPSPVLKPAVSREVFEQFRSLQIEPALDARLVSISGLQGPAPEAFRLLAARVRHIQKCQPLHKLVITSTTAKEGKSFVSGNLACTLALDATQKILLIEGDLRCPSLSRLFGIRPPAGIGDYLSATATLQESIFKLEGAGIWIMPAGSRSTTPLDFLRPAPLTEMLDQLAHWFDWVIVDAPPTLPLADTGIWERVVDGILLVARQGMTRKGLLAKGLEATELDKVIGTVLNCSEESLQYGDYYNAPAASE